MTRCPRNIARAGHEGTFRKTTVGAICIGPLGAERKAFESYIRYGHVPDALLGVKAARAHEPTLPGKCANCPSRR